MKLMALVLLFLAGGPVVCGPKLVEYGWDVPDTAYVRKNIQEMEKVPFDGVVIKVDHKDPAKGHGMSMGWNVFSRERFVPEDYQHAIDDLKATQFKRFTDNFIQVISHPGDVDWFSPAWAVISYNAGCMARVAKETGCKGIMFDPEMYGKYPMWCYSRFPDEYKSKHTFQEYTAKARERGREFIRAINREYPDITILALFGTCISYVQSQGSKLEDVDYALLAAFYDGLCEAATSDTILVDGFEFSYGYRTRDQFKEGRKIVLEGSKSISLNPGAFKKHVRCGFGVWADFNSAHIVFDPKDHEQNYFSPEGLRATLNYALSESDGYVWVYSERFDWWKPSYVKDFNGYKGMAPREYIEALRLAKEGPGPGQKNIPKMPPVKAASLPEYSDSETFPKLGTDLKEVFDFPKQDWKFQLDAGKTGEKEGWFEAGFDDSSWKPIEIGKFWEEQGDDYDGAAWYRLKFKAPQTTPAMKTFLAFGAVDEVADVWLNGKPVGRHDIGGGGWIVPFMLDVKEHLKPQEENTLAVRVVDTTGMGGIWKSVKLMEK